LSLPSIQSLCEGHCLIVPMSHQLSSITCDEEIWNEMQVWAIFLKIYLDQHNLNILEKLGFPKSTCSHV
jgi:hypothetical protein